MGGVLVRTLARIKKRPAGGQRIGNDNGRDTARPSPEEGSGGLPGLCRAVCRHCVEAVGFVDPCRDAKGSESSAVSR